MSTNIQGEQLELALAASSKTVKPKKTEDNPQVNVEIGSTATMTAASWDEWAGVTIGSNGEVPRGDALAIEKLVEMRRKDGQARYLMRLLTLPIRNALNDASWVEPEEGDAEEETKFANDMWTLPPQAGGMTVPISMVIRQTLLALVEGFSCFEEVRHVPQDGPLQGKITIQKLAHRDSRTIKFRVDDTGGFDGVRQVANVAGAKPIDVVIPRDKTWYYAANEEENPYYGVSMFEAAYEHYTIKRKLYYIAHLAAQFAAVPGRVGIMPQGTGARQAAQFQDALSKFAFNTAMTVPANFEVKPFNGSSNFEFIKLIDHHNNMMSKSVLAGFADADQRPVLIDNNAKDASADLFIQALEALMSEIAESWSIHLMPRYIDWNFDSKKYPVFKFGQLTDSSRDAIKEVFTALVTASMLNCTPEFMRESEIKLAERLGFDIDYEEIAKHEKEVAEAKAEEEALQAEQDLATGGDGSGADPTAAVPDPNAPPAPETAGPTTNQQVAASGGFDGIDDLLLAAKELFETRPEGYQHEEPDV